MRKHTSLHISTLKMQNQTKDLGCKNWIHEVMIFTLLPRLSRNTWWFTCNGDPQRKRNIQPLSCWLFLRSLSFFFLNCSFQSTHKSRSTSRLSSGGSNSPAPYADAAWMDTKWLRLQCHSRHLARRLFAVRNLRILGRWSNTYQHSIKSKKWRNHPSRSCHQLERGIPHLWAPAIKLPFSIQA